MKKLLLFWWHYLTDSGFRHWVGMHDHQAFLNDIERRRRDMLEYQSRSLLIVEFGEEEGQKIHEQSLQIAEHCRRNGITEHSINESGSCNMGCC